MSDSGRERRRCCRYCRHFHYDDVEDLAGCRQTLTDEILRLRALVVGADLVDTGKSCLGDEPLKLAREREWGNF